MSSLWKNPITAGVITIHVIFLLLLAWYGFAPSPLHPNDKTTDPTGTTGTSSQQQTANTPGDTGTPNPPTTPTTPSSKPTAGNPPLTPQTPPRTTPSVVSGKYYHGYYTVATQQLPAKLLSQVKHCRSGLVLDMDKRTILWQKNATTPYPIASITKLLTSIMLLEHIERDPATTLNTRVTVTKQDFPYTRRARGVYLNVNESLTLQEYLKCMIISSANDCAYMVAKFLGGTQEAFAAKMNQRAAELGLTDMRFHNPNGLPIDRRGTRTENMGSALSVAYLSELATKYPEIMKWAGTTADCIREDGKRFDLNSTNKLLRARVKGVTGLKTGYTDTAGYCIVVTAERDGRRLMVIVMGVLKTGDYGKRRDAIARQLLEWAYSVK